MPAPVAEAARGSLGAAVQIPGELGTQIADAAREAFINAMSWGSIVVASTAAVGAFIAWRYLPARAEDDTEDVVTAVAEPVGRFS